jgi:hypothetical protein
MLLKQCRRCNGDLYLSFEIDGTYLVCLQCGDEHQLTPMQAAQVKQQARR